MKYKGRLVFEGYAIDNIFVYDEENKSRQKKSDANENQFERFVSARKSAVKTFEELYARTLKTVGENEASLFQTYKLMAEDLDFEDLVRNSIENDHLMAEQAVLTSGKQLADTFSALDDEYMKERATDVLEVSKVINDILLGKTRVLNLTSPVILICKDLAASVLMCIDKKMLRGLVLTDGNENSHVSIFARTLEIPTLVGVEKNFVLSTSLTGKKAILDTIKGNLIVEPTQDEIKNYTKIKNSYEKENLELKKFIGKESITKDGVKIKICANITSTLEIESAVNYDAEGIGLFRSEFIYLASKNYPSEDFQFNYYREVVEEMKGKEVIIRTFDIGADKKIYYFNLPKEENPALGYRSIRICRDRPEILYTQLRALYRASNYGNLSIMIPMIVSLEEVEFVHNLIKKVKTDLKKEKIPFNDKVRVGIMIETPAAAMISEVLAKKVDFFSIGTNDLSQYTLACDRLNPLLNTTFDSKHPSILRLIKLTVDNAHKAGIPCGMCGELGRNPDVIPFLAAIHLDEISCSSAYILKTRKLLSTIDTKNVDIEKYLLK